MSDERDQRKSNIHPLFRQAREIAAQGGYEYAIDLYLDGLAITPADVEMHQELREVSLRRKAGGGKAMAIAAALKLRRPTQDPKQTMLNAEKLLAYDPGNTEHMLTMLQWAKRGGLNEIAEWMASILQMSNSKSL